VKLLVLKEKEGDKGKVSFFFHTNGSAAFHMQSQFFKETVAE